MLSILRDDARGRAEGGFDRLLATANSLAKRNPEDTKAVGILKNAISDARDRVKIETDTTIGAEQSLHADKLYRGAAVTIDGQRWEFDHARWVEYGPNYRLTEVMHGEHFNKLPANTPTEKAYKHGRAKATLTLQLFTFFRGGRFDLDRHGGQDRGVPSANGPHVIGMFDDGGLTLKPPTRSEKEAAARVFTSFAKSGSEKSLRDSIENEVKGDPRLRLYLSEVQTSLLATNDFRRELSPSDLADILTGMKDHPAIDPIFQQAITNVLNTMPLHHRMAHRVTAKPVLIEVKPF
jgi:hypothetical protein